MMVEDLKNKNLRMAMQQVGFVEVLQMTYVELDPKSVIPIHRDDCTYFTGKHIIDGPSQLWLRISGDHKKVKIKYQTMYFGFTVEVLALYLHVLVCVEIGVYVYLHMQYLIARNVWWKLLSVSYVVAFDCTC